jgi:hypothetical protein
MINLIIEIKKLNLLAFNNYLIHKMILIKKEMPLISSVGKIQRKN